MKNNKERNFVSDPSPRGQHYLTIIDRLFDDRVGEIDVLAIPVSCYLEMGLPSRFGDLTDREFSVCYGTEVQIGVKGHPLMMKFSSAWDDAFLSQACRNLEEFSKRTWAAFLEVNSRHIPGSSGEPPRVRLTGFADSFPEVLRRFRHSKN